MGARLRIGKLHVSLALATASLLGLFVDSGGVQRAYDDVLSRQSVRQQQYSSTMRHAVESKESEQERKNAPRRLDLLQGASGQPLDPRSIFALSSPVGDGFGKLVADKGGFALEVKEPAGAWTRLPTVHFDASLVLMRHGKDCVRLEDPVEPTANYYAVCMAPEGITIHTVGELDSFS